MNQLRDFLTRLRLTPPEPVLAVASPQSTRNIAFAKNTQDDDKRIIDVQRRRRSEPPPAGGRERADAPERRRDDEGGAARPPSGSGGSGSGGSGSGGSGSAGAGGLGGGLGGAPRPSGGKSGRSPWLIIGALVLLFICAMQFGLFSGGGDQTPAGQLPADQAPQDQGLFSQGNDAQAPLLDEPTAVVEQPTRPAARPTRTPKPAAASASAGAASDKNQKWLIMLYQDADDKILEKDIFVDLNEAERIGSSEQVQIVAQIDRYRAGFQGDGDWSSARRYFVTQDDDLERVRSRVVQDLGEANMADGATLVDFVTWAVANYPADKYVLILSDHGMGWPGGWSDPTASARSDRRIPLTSALGDVLYLNELDDALAEIRSQTGIEKFELVGMDACLMGHLEVFSMLAPYANYAVASQETEPALGWAYTGFLSALEQNPAMNGGDLGRIIVQTYIQEDQRIVDDQARADFVNQGSPLGGLFGGFSGPSIEQLTAQLGRNITLTAADLSKMPALTESVNDFALALQQVNQRGVAQARSYAQSFTSVFGGEVPPSYIDLANFAQLTVRATRDQGVSRAAEAVVTAVSNLVLAEKHGPDKPGATGVSIYFPNSMLYQNPATGPQSYTAVASRFAQESLWDEFLALHYTGRQFQAETRTLAVPESGIAVRGPGAGPIQASAVTASSLVAAPGVPVQLSADIKGDNVGYVKLFVGFYDQKSNSINVTDMDYLESPNTQKVDGVYYPDWGEGAFTMRFEWEPIVYAIDDGATTAVAAFTPQSYGAKFQDAVYTVDGMYTFASGGETRYARLYFRDGVLRQVFGFTGETATGAPREITPATGDQFTVLETWMDLDQKGQVVRKATQPGKTLTFGSDMFRWKELDAAAGLYLVGFIIEDLDGNSTATYTQINVR